MELILALVGLAALGFIGYRIYKKKTSTPVATTAPTTDAPATTDAPVPPSN